MVFHRGKHATNRQQAASNQPIKHSFEHTNIQSTFNQHSFQSNKQSFNQHKHSIIQSGTTGGRGENEREFERAFRAADKQARGSKEEI